MKAGPWYSWSSVTTQAEQCQLINGTIIVSIRSCVTCGLDWGKAMSKRELFVVRPVAINDIDFERTLMAYDRGSAKVAGFSTRSS